MTLMHVVFVRHHCGRNIHIFVRNRLKSTGKSITCTQFSQSIDNDLVDYR